MPDSKTSQEELLIAHVHDIFRAFLERDRDRIRELHSEDWIGFLGPSSRIERGIADYMRKANLSLDAFRGTAYEIHDAEVQMHGDLGLVFYVATYHYEGENQDVGSVPLRSVDIFRRTPDGWIQIGSHISVIPAGGKWGETDPEMPSAKPGGVAGDF